MFGMSQSVLKKYELPVAELDRTIEVHRHPRARRMTLRVSHTKRSVRLTIPKTVGNHEASAFVSKNMDWLKQQLLELPVSIPFQNDTVFPLKGEQCRIRFMDGKVGRSRVQLSASDNEKILKVDNSDGRGEERVQNWLRSEARQTLLDVSQKHADRLGLSFSRISVRDQTTRWGSCSSNGTLSFSWRLILAPEYVLDYVAAHEVSHLKEMNHSARFWRLVEQTMPEFDEARVWLADNGGLLHCYGAKS